MVSSIYLLRNDGIQNDNYAFKQFFFNTPLTNLTKVYIQMYVCGVLQCMEMI